LDNNINDFEEIEVSAAEKRRLQDFDDLQNELSGNEVGRISRFLSPEARAALIEKRNGNTTAALSALDVLLLNDPIYAQAYSETMSALKNAEQATARALEKANANVEKTESALADTLEQAAQLPNGTRVFRDGQSQVWTEDDIRVDEDQADVIEWRGNEPSRETFLKQRTDNQDAKNRISETLTYQTDVLGRIRDKMSDSDSPPTAEDMENFKDEISTRQPAMVQATITNNSSTAAVTNSATIGIPTLD